MNYNNKLKERKRILGLFQGHSQEGTLKWSNESYDHFKTKAEVFHYLKSNDYLVWSEPVLKITHKRPDLVCLHKKGTVAYIIEIKKTETENSLKSKLDTYPLPIIVVDTKTFNFKEFKL